MTARQHGTLEPDLNQMPADYPSNRIGLDSIADGTRVRFRPAVPDDALELRTGLDRLSGRSAWLEDLVPIPSCTDEELRQAFRADHQDVELLVAEVDIGRHFQPVALARYARRAGERTSADVQIVVEDDWQDRGIGVRLLERLKNAAAEAGITQFHARIVEEPQRVLRLLREVANDVDIRERGTEVLVTAAL